MNSRILQANGHLIDSGLLSNILNTILSKGGDYRILAFDVGKTPEETSHLEIELFVEDEELLQSIIDAVKLFGIYEKEVPSASYIEADKDSHAPDSFYSTSNHKTEVYYKNTWYVVEKQRMDGVIVYHQDKDIFVCTKLRDIKQGDKIICDSASIRIFPPESERKNIAKGDFAFMTNTVSSERSVSATIEALAKEMVGIKERGGKTVVVAGPVVVHTGGSDALASLIRGGYVQGFLGGNAIAVHDIEYRLFGTSLGVDLQTGIVAEHGHSHHMRSINTIYGCGSIEHAVKMGVLTSGLMYEIITSGIPYSLAGSIRDDGPLPETVNDMIEAQRQYSEIIKNADLIIMLSSMLHSIGVGNMSPSEVKTICVDINPAVVTKLSDRGSNQAIGVVSDVGFFLRTLSNTLQ